jgi:inositol-phosphate phosphatase / L-galactose 1-phosphate phosphatase / histidinol-phosphatase
VTGSGSACPPAFVELANRMADAAGEVARRYFRTPIAVDIKPDNSPVTVADREAEAAMRTLIAREASGHGIYGEEMGKADIGAEFVWVLDPIDGTKAFITGKPSFGILIALLHRGVPILGVIDQPITRERWVGASGQPTMLNEQPIRVRGCDALEHAVLYATAPEMFKGAEVAAWENIRRRVKLTRYGADCYAYGLCALGLVDLVVESSMQPYDYCALVPVVEGAGGVVSDWQGGRLGLASGGQVLAAGDARTHAAAAKVLSGVQLNPA